MAETNQLTATVNGINYTISASGQPEYTEHISGGGFTYGTYNYDGEFCVDIIKYKGAHLQLQIPEEIELPITDENDPSNTTMTFRIRRINSGAFQGNKALTSLVVPKTIEEIGFSAFEGCGNIQKITLPFVGGTRTSQKYLGHIFGAGDVNAQQSIMSYFPKLVEVIITDENIISENAFYQCMYLYTITLKGPVKAIGSQAFYDCRQLRTVALPKTILQIGSAAFNTNTTTYIYYEGSEEDWKKVVKTNSGFNASRVMYQCSWDLAYSYEKDNNNKDYAKIIGKGQCQDTYIKIPHISPYGFPVVIIDEEAFCNTDITGIEIPNTVTIIGPNAFSECSNLSKIQLSQQLTEIPSNMCANCTSLEEIVIPDSVKTIYSYPLQGCSSLKSLTIPFVGENEDGSGNPYFGYLFGEGPSEPNGSWEDSLYYNQQTPSSLQNVVITSAKQIKDYAFRGCSNIKSIKFPSTIESFGSGVCIGCNKLEVLEIDENESYYSQNNCIIKKDQLEGEAAYTIEIGCKTSQIPVDDSVTSIGENAFADCSGLTDIIIPDNITSIGYHAFWNCTKLTKITIPNSISRIGQGAFNRCSSLQEIVLPFIGHSRESVTSNTPEARFPYIFMADGAELNTLGEHVPASLKSVKITEGITQLNSHAFYKCSNLSAIELPDTITESGWGPFHGCSRLVTVKLSKNLKSLGTETFGSCSSLEELVIPDTVETMERGQVRGCTKLQSLTVPFVGKTDNDNIGYLFWAEEEPEANKVIPNSLKSLTITRGTEFPGEALGGYEGLSELNIVGDSVKEIKLGALSSCINLQKLSLPCVGRYQIYEKELEPPNTQSLIEEWADGTQNATEQNLGYIFAKNEEDIKDPKDNTKYLNRYALSYKIPTTLQELTITNGQIGYRAIQTTDKHSLKKINLLTEQLVYKQGLYILPTLTHLNIGPEVSQLYNASIFSHKNLTYINVDESNPHYYSDLGCLIATEANTDLGISHNQLIMTANKYGHVSKTATAIGAYAYTTSFSLGQEITIPDNIKHLRNFAFYDSNIKKLTLHSNITDIADGILQECDYIEEVTIPYITNSHTVESYPQNKYFLRYFGYSKRQDQINYNQDKIFEVAETEDYYYFNKPPQTLKKVTITGTSLDSLNGICTNAFCGCDFIETLGIGSNISKVQNGAFVNNLYNLKNIYYNSSTLTIEKQNPDNEEELIAIFGYGTTVPNSKQISVVIGTDVEIVPAHLFNPEGGLTLGIGNIGISNGPKVIKADAFGNAVRPMTVYYPNEVSIEEGAFGDNITLLPRKVLKLQDYVGFTYNGKHSITDLKIYRVSKGGRYDDNLTATMVDKIVDIPGNNGQYYFGTTFKNRIFTIDYAFNNLTEKDIRLIKQTFSGDGIHELIFDEAPYKVWSAKVTGTASMKHLCFEENGQRLYRGEGSITFTCYYPFAKSPNKLWSYNLENNGNTELLSTDGRFLSNYQDYIYYNKNQWADEECIWISRDGENQTSNLLKGDQPSPIILRLSAPSDTAIQSIYYKDPQNTLLSFPSLLTIPGSGEGNYTIKWDSKTGLIVVTNGTEQKIVPYNGNGTWKLKPGENCSSTDFGVKQVNIIDSNYTNNNELDIDLSQIQVIFLEILDDVGYFDRTEYRETWGFSKIDYTQTENGEIRLTLYEQEDEDFYYYVDKEKIEEVTYDKWEKVEPFGDESIINAKKYIYTNQVVQKSVDVNIDVQFDFIYN